MSRCLSYVSLALVVALALGCEPEAEETVDAAGGAGGQGGAGAAGGAGGQGGAGGAGAAGGEGGAGGGPCPDADGDGSCDAEDRYCNADLTPLACRQQDPPCPRGTVPEIRQGCFTQRCLTWAECAAGPVACEPVAEGEFGPCEAIIGWGVGAEGRCTFISGCGCDARCEGRVFPDEAACLAACDGGCRDSDGDGACDDEDRICNLDREDILCDLAFPECPEGMVAEAAGGCFTRRCVTWDDCDPVGPGECRQDEDCAPGQACVDGRCDAAACRLPEIGPRHPRFARYEGTELPNACRRDDDCVISGCSGEVCAADAAATTCEGLPDAPQGGCGCVDGSCIWYTDACEPPPCPDTDGDGICDAEDPICDQDREPVICLALPPACGRGTVPEALGGCWTGRCVDWDTCAAGPVAPGRCRQDADCGPDQICVDGRCADVICRAPQRVPELSPRDPGYARYEGTELPNACRQDADCQPSGCSGEVCAADAAFTTCEALPDAPRGGCGCVAGTCLWYLEVCEGPCPDADGDGICDAADEVCNADGQEVICRALPPACRLGGTVPEARGGCWTGACVPWAECGAPAPPMMCGGFAGFLCPDGQQCVDDPGDDCEPGQGGADCAGICVDDGRLCSPVAPGEFGLCEAVLGFAADGRGGCRVVSGCGCDDRCAGRVFPSERECLNQCARRAP